MKTSTFSTALSQHSVKNTEIADRFATQKIRFPSPAKLNLFLYINGRLANGYHELQTLFQFLDFNDYLDIEINQTGDIQITPAIPDLKPEDNLIYRAAILLQQKTHCRLGAKIHLEKILPMGGGVGGGSSNAATTLLALNYLWQTQLCRAELAELGLQLGADVPIFIHGKAAFAEGVGEKIVSCEPAKKWYVVLKPAVSISTAAIFNAKDLPRDTAKLPLNQLLNQPYKNDCENVVKNQYPEVEECLNWLLQYAPARLTGTGACVFAEFSDEDAAQAVFKQKPTQYFGFVAKGLNVSPLHTMLENLIQSNA